MKKLLFIVSFALLLCANPTNAKASTPSTTYLETLKTQSVILMGGGGGTFNSLNSTQAQLFESSTVANKTINETPESAFTFNGTTNTLIASTDALASWVNTLSEDADGLKRIRIVIPEKTTTIGEKAFFSLFSDKAKFGTIRIIGIDFSKAIALTSIAADAFACIGHSSSGIFTNSDLMSEFTEPLILPDTITSIGIDNNSGAFRYFKSLGELKLPSNVKYTTINKYTFNYSQFSGTITIPNQIQTINDRAFWGFGNKVIDVFLAFEENSKLETIGSYCFNSAQFKGNLTLPNSLTSFTGSSPSTFQASTFDGTLTLPTNSSFTIIPSQAFSEAKFTGELVIPENVITIEKNAFKKTSFNKLTFSGTPKITTLGSSAFSECTILAQPLIIPESMREFEADYGPFQKCTALKGAITLPDGMISLSQKSFDGSGVQTVYLPNNDSTKYIGSKSSSSNSIFVFATQAQFFANYTNFNKAGLEVTLFSDEFNERYLALLNQPFNVVKDSITGIWTPGTAPTLPENKSDSLGYDKGWAFSNTPNKIITKTSAITTTRIISSNYILSVPTIGESQNIKGYSDQTHTLTAIASHPMDATPEQIADKSLLEIDNIIYNYKWIRVKNYSPTGEILGNEKTYTVKPVDYQLKTDADFITVEVIAGKWDGSKFVGYWSNAATGGMNNRGQSFYIDITEHPKVEFDSNGGIGSIDSQLFDIDTSFELKKNAFSKDSFIFLGWNTAKDGSGDSYADQATVKFNKINLTLFAQWGPVLFNQTFDEIAYKQEEDSEMSIPTPTFKLTLGETVLKGEEIKKLNFFIDGSSYNLETKSTQDSDYKDIFLYDLPFLVDYSSDTVIVNNNKPDTVGVYQTKISTGAYKVTVKYNNIEAPIQFGIGNLEILPVNTEKTHFTPSETTVPEKEVNVATPVIEDDTLFVNSAGNEIASTAKIVLLQDELEESVLKNNITDSIREIQKFNDYITDLTYLDLVDANNGNSIVTPNKEIQVVLPYPPYTDSSVKFTLLHILGIDRSQQSPVSIENENQIVEMQVSNIPAGIQFSTNSFSPFALLYNPIHVAPINDCIFTGRGITPDIKITMINQAGHLLTKDSDYTVEFSNNINVGTATATITFISPYSGTEVVNFEIKKADISIKIPTMYQKEGETPFTKRTVSLDPIIEGESISYTFEPSPLFTAPYAAGEYDIIAKFITTGNKDNYNVAWEIGKLIVKNLPYAIIELEKIDNYTLVKGYNVPLKTKTPEAMKVTYTSSNTNVVKIVNNSEMELVGAGSAIISVVSDLTANYLPSNDSQKVLITHGTQTIQWVSIPSTLPINKTAQIEAIATSGGAINYMSNNPSVVIVKGNVLHPVSEGFAYITAEQEGDENFLQIRSEARLIEITSSDIVDLTPRPEGYDICFDMPSMIDISIDSSTTEYTLAVKIKTLDRSIPLKNMKMNIYVSGSGVHAYQVKNEIVFDGISDEATGNLLLILDPLNAHDREFEITLQSIDVSGYLRRSAPYFVKGKVKVKDQKSFLNSGFVQRNTPINGEKEAAIALYNAEDSELIVKFKRQGNREAKISYNSQIIQPSKNNQFSISLLKGHSKLIINYTPTYKSSDKPYKEKIQILSMKNGSKKVKTNLKTHYVSMINDNPWVRHVEFAITPINADISTLFDIAPFVVNINDSSRITLFFSPNDTKSDTKTSLGGNVKIINSKINYLLPFNAKDFAEQGAIDQFTCYVGLIGGGLTKIDVIIYIGSPYARGEKRIILSQKSQEPFTSLKTKFSAYYYKKYAKFNPNKPQKATKLSLKTDSGNTLSSKNSTSLFNKANLDFILKNEFIFETLQKDSMNKIQFQNLGIQINAKDNNSKVVNKVGAWIKTIPQITYIEPLIIPYNNTLIPPTLGANTQKNSYNALLIHGDYFGYKPKAMLQYSSKGKMKKISLSVKYHKFIRGIYPRYGVSLSGAPVELPQSQIAGKGSKILVKLPQKLEDLNINNERFDLIINTGDAVNAYQNVFKSNSFSQ